MRINPNRLTTCLVISVLAAACGRDAGLEPTPTPTILPAAAQATATPAPQAPISPANDYQFPAAEAAFPLDLVSLEPGNATELAPFRELTAGGLPQVASGATLAFTASFEYSLAAHLDQGQTIVWNMAGGEVTFQDHYPSDGSQSAENPALAISPGFQGYLATSAAGNDATVRTIVIRPPSVGEAPISLPAAGLAGDDTQRVSSLAFSPDGRLLAVGMGGLQGGLLQVWDIWEQDAPSLIAEVAFDDEVGALQFTSDGLTLVCSAGDELVSLDPLTGTELGRRTFGFVRGGYLAGPSGRTVAAWESSRAVIESPLRASPLEIPAVIEIRQVVFTPDERLAVLIDGGRLRLWDLSLGVELVSYGGDVPFLDVAVLDNGRVLATIDQETRVLLWGVSGGFRLPESLARILPSNAASLQPAASLYIPGGLGARLSPQSEWLAVGSGEGVYLVDLPSLQLLRRLELADPGFTVFDASADGRRLAWLADRGVVRVWDLQQDSLTGQIVIPDEGCCGQILLMPDGQSMVTLAGQTARLWDLATGDEVYSRADVQAVHVSPDGSRLAFESGISLRVSIWDRRTGRDVRQLTGFETAAPIYGVRFSPDWSTMYWAARASMQFSDVDSGALGAFVPYSWGAFSPRGDRIAVVEDGWIYQTVGQVIVLGLDSGETLAVLDHHADAIVRSVAYSPDGRLLATALGDTIKIWDGLSGAELATLPPAGGSVGSLEFSAGGEMLVSTSDGGVVELWVASGETAAGPSAITPAPASATISPAAAGLVEAVDSLLLTEPATDAVFSPDRATVTVSTASGKIWQWHVAAGWKSGSPTHTDWIYHLAYSPSGTGLASVSKDGELEFWDPFSALGGSADEHEGEVSALAFLPDGEFVATSGQDGMLRFWELPDLRSALVMQAHAAWVWDLAASPGGDLLATASADRTVKLWSVGRDASGAPQLSALTTLTGHTETVWGVGFSPDGDTLASASWDKSLRLWDVPSGQQLAVLQGHTDWVYDVAFSPDGSVLASSSADGTVRLWDPVAGELLATLEASPGRVWSVDFSPDGRRLVSAADSGEVVLWGVVP